MLAKESKDAFVSIRDDVDMQEARIYDMANEFTEQQNGIKNKFKEMVIEQALLQQALEAKDLGWIRHSVMEGFNRTQFDRPMNQAVPASINNSMIAILMHANIGLTMLEESVSNLQKSAGKEFATGDSYKLYKRW